MAHAETTQGLMAKAMVHHQKDQFAEAELYYKRVLKIDRNHSDALHLSGVALHQLGRNVRAVKLIKKAIANDSRKAIFHMNLAIIYVRTSQWNEAELVSRRSIQLSPNDGEMWAILGESLAGLGTIDEAIKAFEKSLILKPNNIQVYCNLASLLTVAGVQSATGRLDEAETSFKKVLQLDPHMGQTITNLASIYTTKTKYVEAISLFKKVIEVNPNSTEAYFNLGVCYSECGEMDEALNCFNRTLEIDPNNISAYYAIATSG